MAMERVTVEQNGERFTLEVPEGTSDDQIRSFLTQQQGGGITQLTQPEPAGPIEQTIEQASPQIANAALRTTLPTAVDLVTQGPIAKAASSFYNKATPQMAAGIVAHPIEAAQTVVKNLGGMLPQATLKDIITKGPGAAAQGVGTVARGFGTALTAPENLLTLPYNMAAYEQEKIRANPTAPGLEYNPYAQVVRGEAPQRPVGAPSFMGGTQMAPTQGAAAAANRRRAIAGQQYGGLSPEEQDMLRKDRELSYAMRLQAAKKVLGQP